MNETKRNIEEYKENSKKFGKIGILSNHDTDGETVYLMWKDRENIEVAFDALKNKLEISKVYEIHLGERRKLSEIPDKVMKLAESLELNIFPKKLRS